VGQALQYNGQPHTLLIGERYGKKVNGFDLTNSPLQISQQQLTDKTVVITSTNGTKAINKVKRADHVLMGAFLNASHCVKKACSFKQDIMIICAGRRGKFAIEDGLTAGFMIRQLRQLNPSLELSDMSMLLEHNYECQQDHLHSLIERGATGQTLIESQQEKDIHYCLQLNRLSITGILNGEEIIPVLD
jgi:2-phosphosulfolactate phosphatase